MSRSLRMFVALILPLLPAAQLCAAEALIEFTQRATKTVTTVGNRGTSIWSFEDRNPYSPTYGREFVFVRLEPSSTWKIRRVERTDQGAGIFAPDPVYDYDVSVQGGFFDTSQDGSKFRPVGLVIANSVQLSALESWTSGGVFSLSSLGTSITPVRFIPAQFAPQQAIQSKPLIMEYGANAMRSPDAERFNRTALGLTRNGRIVIAGVFAPNNNASTLHEFANALVEFSRQEGDPLETALNMDGGPGAHIYIRAHRRFHGYEGATFIPNVIDFGVGSFRP